MQFRVFLAFAFLVVGVSSSQSALNTARLWLRKFAGTPPSGDQLAELKAANPEAYALVNALLTKRSLGLLDPRHPTASFSKAEPQQVSPEEEGPEAFAKFASPGELRGSHRQALSQEAAPVAQVALPYANVHSSGSRQDWLNWKPQSSAMDDETMVQNVLGAVAELKGKKAGLLSKHRDVDENPLTAAVEEAEAPKPAPRAIVEERMVVPAEPVATPAELAPAAPKENSYLKGIDLSGDMPKVVHTHEEEAKAPRAQSNNYLAGFSWDDSTPAIQEKPRQATPAPVGPTFKASKNNALLGWLGVVSKQPTPEVAPAAPAKPLNPYIVDLSF